MPDASIHLRALRIAAPRVDERVSAAAYVALGLMILYLVMFDQGQVLELLVGSTASQQDLLHEFFHDGRHLGNVPCH